MHGSHCHWLSEVPDLLGLADRFPESFPFLLDSAARGPLGAHSLLLFAAKDCLIRHGDGHIEGPGEGDGFFDRLESWYQAEKTGRRESAGGDALEIPFTGGWFLFLSYEMAAEIESRLNLPVSETGLPDALACRCPGAIIVFHGSMRGTASTARALVTAESPRILASILGHLEGLTRFREQPLPLLRRLQEEEPEKFKSGVRKVLDYLRSGDAFQVNISRNWQGHFAHPPDALSLYQCLRRNNPAPFAGLMRWNSRFLLSSSPERLIHVRGNQVQTRPIAGTRRRGNNVGEDTDLSHELINNVKERAEHIMLIDLERNDLGRVCRPGTVEVNELMVVESYEHVHHIVSNVRGELTSQASPVRAIKAVFPGGTITGCPKVRCMEIIAELELQGRGFYTGSMGYLGRNGNLDLNILIRTMLLRDQFVSFRTGAGIVADSDPARELEETQEKAIGLLLALGSEAGPSRPADTLRTSADA